MIELQLVGYTADLEYLVFCDAAEGASRFKATVDEDLLATLSEVVERTDPERLTSFLPPVAAPAPPPPPPPPPPPAPPLPRAGPAPGVGPLAAVAVLLANRDEPPVIVEADGDLDAAPAARGSRLSPREIQALLRMGRTPAAVAKAAGVDEGWVQRWLPPIEAERERILAGVRGARVTKARKGPSAAPLGEAVDRNLAAKNADDEVEWSATRRDGDAEWVVAVRYRSRGKARRARWRFDPETRQVEPEDAAARDLAWTPRPGSTEATSRKRSATAKRTPAKRPGTKKPSTAAKTAKKPAATKATAKRAAAKKTTTKKSSAARTTTRKTSAKKPTAKKATPPPATAKTPAARKAGAPRLLLPPPIPVSGPADPPPAPPAPPTSQSPDDRS